MKEEIINQIKAEYNAISVDDSAFLLKRKAEIILNMVRTLKSDPECEAEATNAVLDLEETIGHEIAVAEGAEKDARGKNASGAAKKRYKDDMQSAINQIRSDLSYFLK